MSSSISLIIPTRERAAYLEYALRTCTGNPCPDLEILVLNNASTDNTDEVMSRVTDRRVRYVRNEKRLSMRDNFEKGIELSRGEILCFIGDDDGVFPSAIETALRLFEQHDIEALSAARAHYFWPDLVSARKNTALLPRESGVSILDSRAALRHVLRDCDYYRLPCLYHGFVKRTVVEKVCSRQGRFFLSSQVDMFSSIALSMEGIRFAFSRAPLIVNGASSRSNGASHFGGGSNTEKSLWKLEDELGFLPGFNDSRTVGALIVESAVRYCQANGQIDVSTVLEPAEIRCALATEQRARRTDGRGEDDTAQLFATAGLSVPADEAQHVWSIASSRAARMIRSFLATRPLDLRAREIGDVYAAAHYMARLIDQQSTGVMTQTIEQLMTAIRLARG
jgi:glycosyltransferase involved in cell wall biosynthesis